MMNTNLPYLITTRTGRVYRQWKYCPDANINIVVRTLRVVKKVK